MPHKKPDYEATHHGKKVEAWRKRDFVLVKVHKNNGETAEWEMPNALRHNLEIAADQAAIQS